MEPKEKYYIDKDIRVVCVEATSFPNGVGGAYQKLHSLLPSLEQRIQYGISHGDENGGIIYRAAATELYEGEAERLGLETFIVRKGEYISQLIEDWRKDESQIGKIFKNLLNDPRVDHAKGYCLEIYLNEKDVRCMVLLK